MTETFTITELAREFGVTTRTIRFYEDEGLLAPERQNQARIYRPRDRVRLRLILRGRRLGFSLREIAEILDLYDADPSEVAQLRHFLGKLEERRSALLGQREDIDTILSELEAVEEQCRARLAAREGARTGRPRRRAGGT